MSMSDEEYNFIYTQPVTFLIPSTIIDLTSEDDVKLEKFDSELDNSGNGDDKTAVPNNDLLQNKIHINDKDIGTVIETQTEGQTDKSQSTPKEALLPKTLIPPTIIDFCTCNVDEELDNFNPEPDSGNVSYGDDQVGISDNGLPLNIFKDKIIINGIDIGAVADAETGGQADKLQSTPRDVLLTTTLIPPTIIDLTSDDNVKLKNFKSELDINDIGNCDDEKAVSNHDNLPPNRFTDETNIKYIDTGTMTDIQTGGETEKPQNMPREALLTTTSIPPTIMDIICTCNVNKELKNLDPKPDSNDVGNSVDEMAVFDNDMPVNIFKDKININDIDIGTVVDTQVDAQADKPQSTPTEALLTTTVIPPTDIDLTSDDDVKSKNLDSELDSNGEDEETVSNDDPAQNRFTSTIDNKNIDIGTVTDTQIGGEEDNLPNTFRENLLTTNWIPPTIIDLTVDDDVKLKNLDSELDNNVFGNGQNEKVVSNDNLPLNRFTDEINYKNIDIRAVTDTQTGEHKEKPQSTPSEGLLSTYLISSTFADLYTCNVDERLANFDPDSDIDNVSNSDDEMAFLNNDLFLIDKIDVNNIDRGTVPETQTGEQIDKFQSTFIEAWSATTVIPLDLTHNVDEEMEHFNPKLHCNNSDKGQTDKQPQSTSREGISSWTRHETKEHSFIKHTETVVEGKDKPIEAGAETVPQPQPKFFANNDVANILKRLHLSGPILKKPKQEYRCYTCKEDFPDWLRLEKHLMQHVSLPSVVISKLLPSVDEDTLPAGNSRICAVCNAVFQTTTTLEKHVKEKHVPPIQCEKCFTFYSNYCQFKNHVSDGCHRRFKCRFCDKSYLWFYYVQRHENSVHTKKIVYQCDMCQQKQFGDKSELRKHILSHLGLLKTYSCDICGYVFHYRSHLNRHISNIHENIKAFYCDICGRKFAEKNQLTRHLIRHAGLKKERCPNCPKMFYDVWHLRSHMKTHVLHICKFCGKYFSSHMNRHLRTHTHTNLLGGRIKMLCEICGKGFSKKYCLEKHIGVIHGFYIKIYSKHATDFKRHQIAHNYFETYTRTSVSSKFLCEICGKGFCNKYSLKKHARVIHDLENNKIITKVKCPIFEKHVRDSEKHQKVHNPVETHTQTTIRTKVLCEICGNFFCDKYSLEKHAAIIHGFITRFICPVCKDHVHDLEKHQKVYNHFEMHTPAYENNRVRNLQKRFL